MLEKRLFHYSILAKHFYLISIYKNKPVFYVFVFEQQRSLKIYVLKILDNFNYKLKVSS